MKTHVVTQQQCKIVILYILFDFCTQKKAQDLMFQIKLELKMVSDCFFKNNIILFERNSTWKFLNAWI